MAVCLLPLFYSPELTGLVPFSGAAFAILALFLRLDSPSTPLVSGLLAVDWIGSITIVGATLTLLGLEFGGVIFAWSSVKVLCLIIFGIVIGCGFLVNEGMFARYPVIPLQLFRRRPNVAALSVAFFHGLVCPFLPETPCNELIGIDILRSILLPPPLRPIRPRLLTSPIRPLHPPL